MSKQSCLEKRNLSFGEIKQVIPNNVKINIYMESLGDYTNPMSGNYEDDAIESYESVDLVPSRYNKYLVNEICADKKSDEKILIVYLNDVTFKPINIEDLVMLLVPSQKVKIRIDKKENDKPELYKQYNSVFDIPKDLYEKRVIELRKYKDKDLVEIQITDDDF